MCCISAFSLLVDHQPGLFPHIYTCSVSSAKPFLAGWSREGKVRGTGGGVTQECSERQKCTLTGLVLLCWGKDNDWKEWIYLEDADWRREWTVRLRSTNKVKGAETVLTSEVSISVKGGKKQCWYSKLSRAGQRTIMVPSAWFDKYSKSVHVYVENKLWHINDETCCLSATTATATWFVLPTSVAGGQMWNSLCPVGNKSHHSERDCAKTDTLSHSIHFWPLVETVQYCRVIIGWRKERSTIYLQLSCWQFTKNSRRLWHHSLI